MLPLLLALSSACQAPQLTLELPEDPLAGEVEVTIKGNVDSMLYHRPDSRSFGETIAEVWFDSPESAEAAGFTLANTHPHS